MKVSSGASAGIHWDIFSVQVLMTIPGEQYTSSILHTCSCTRWFKTGLRVFHFLQQILVPKQAW